MRTAIATAVTAALLLTGCATSPGEEPLYSSARGVSATLSRAGGVCPDGPCDHSVTISSDRDTGRTDWEASDGSSGSTDTDATVELFDFIRSTFPQLQEEPLDGTCPTAHDGQRVTLVYGQVPVGPDAHLADAIVMDADTCTYVWPDGFLDQTRLLWDATTAPWPLA